MSIPRLIRRPLFGEAFTFGWKHLAGALNEYFLLYIVIVLIGTAGVIWSATTRNFYFATTCEATAIVGFTALATASRFAISEFRMTGQIVLGIIGIMLVQLGCTLAAMGLLVAGGAFFAAIHSGLLFLYILIVGSAAVIVLSWAITKVTLASAIYVLRYGEGRSIMDAFRDSWAYVVGDDWWRVAFLTLSISFICQFIPQIVLRIVFYQAMNGGNVVLDATIGAIVLLVPSIISAIWIQLSLVAFSSACIGDPQAVGP